MADRRASSYRRMLRERTGSTRGRVVNRDKPTETAGERLQRTITRRSSGGSSSSGGEERYAVTINGRTVTGTKAFAEKAQALARQEQNTQTARSVVREQFFALDNTDRIAGRAIAVQRLKDQTEGNKFIGGEVRPTPTSRRGGPSVQGAVSGFLEPTQTLGDIRSGRLDAEGRLGATVGIAGRVGAEYYGGLFLGRGAAFVGNRVGRFVAARAGTTAAVRFERSANAAGVLAAGYYGTSVVRRRDPDAVLGLAAGGTGFARGFQSFGVRVSAAGDVTRSSTAWVRRGSGLRQGFSTSRQPVNVNFFGQNFGGERVIATRVTATPGARRGRAELATITEGGGVTFRGGVLGRVDNTFTGFLNPRAGVLAGSGRSGVIATGVTRRGASFGVGSRDAQLFSFEGIRIPRRGTASGSAGFGLSEAPAPFVARGRRSGGLRALDNVPGRVGRVDARQLRTTQLSASQARSSLDRLGVGVRRPPSVLQSRAGTLRGPRTTTMVESAPTRVRSPRTELLPGLQGLPVAPLPTRPALSPVFGNLGSLAGRTQQKNTFAALQPAAASQSGERLRVEAVQSSAQGNDFGFSALITPTFRVGQPTRPRTTSPTTSITPGTTTPGRPGNPLLGPPGVPGIPFWGVGGRNGRRQNNPGREFEYSPSLVSVFSGETGPETQVLTGLEVRKLTKRRRR
ncbi:MAG: hypothetical protein LC650_02330 [Actinobacteria bacterium]|nr:hypothetical protein [Actinomycetota bacterium]